MLEIELTPKQILADETIITLRGLDTCRELKTQEFARIIFVDDITNYSAKAEDHEPLKDIPSYESQDVPKIVS